MNIREKKDKLKKLIASILALGGEMPKVKLAKLVFLCDRENFIKTGSSITGLYYVRLPNGPVVAFYDEILEEGLEENLWVKEDVPVQVWSESRVKTQYNYKTRQRPNLNKNELQTVQEIIEKCGKATGTRLSAVTHNIPAWKYSEPYEPVNIAELSVDTEEEYFAMLDILEEMEEGEDKELADQISRAIPEVFR